MQLESWTSNGNELKVERLVDIMAVAWGHIQKPLRILTVRNNTLGCNLKAQ